MSAKIQKIILKIGKKEIELSMEEAKELKKILGDIFQEKEFIPIPFPQPHPVFPIQHYYGAMGGSLVG